MPFQKDSESLCCNKTYFVEGVVFRDIVIFLRFVARLLSLVGVCILVAETQYYQKALEKSDGVFNLGYVGYCLLASGIITTAVFGAASAFMGVSARMCKNKRFAPDFWPEYEWEYITLELVNAACYVASSVYIMQVVHRYWVDPTMTDGLKCDGIDKEACAVIRTSQYQVLYGHDLLMTNDLDHSMISNPLKTHKYDIMYLDESTMALAWIFLIKALVVFATLAYLEHKPWVILPLKICECDISKVFHSDPVERYASIRNHDWVSHILYFIGFLVISSGLRSEHAGSYIVAKSVMNDSPIPMGDVERCAWTDSRSLGGGHYSLFTDLNNGTMTMEYLKHFKLYDDHTIVSTGLYNLRMNQLSCYNTPAAYGSKWENVYHPNLNAPDCCPGIAAANDMSESVGNFFLAGHSILLVGAILALLSESAFLLATWSFGDMAVVRMLGRGIHKKKPDQRPLRTTTF